jgi:ABC-type branched-subunit amino acid transport system substrate-binding protein
MKNKGEAVVKLKVLAIALTVALTGVTAAAPALVTTDVVIGDIDDLTGVYSDNGGIGAIEAIKMAIADFGGSVLNRKIMLLTADHQNKADVGASKAREWADQRGLNMLLAGANTGVAIAMAKDGAVRVPLSTSDFSSFLLQAQASGAQVLGLANAGDDFINSLKSANEFGLTQTMKPAGLLVFVNNIDGLGLKTAQGLYLTTAWYWDLNPDTRAFGKRFFDKMKREPSMSQSGSYSATMTYLKAVAAAGTTDPEKVMTELKKTAVRASCTIRFASCSPENGCVGLCGVAFLIRGKPRIFEHARLMSRAQPHRFDRRPRSCANSKGMAVRADRQKDQSA